MFTPQCDAGDLLYSWQIDVEEDCTAIIQDGGTTGWNGRSKTMCVPTSLDFSACVTETVDAYTHNSNNIYDINMAIECDDEYVLSSFTMLDNGQVTYTCCDVGSYGTYTPGYYDDSCTSVTAKAVDGWDYLDMCAIENSDYMVGDAIKGLTPYKATCLDSHQEWEQLGNVVAMKGISFFSSSCSSGGADSELVISMNCCMVNVPSSNPVYNAAVGLPTFAINTIVYPTLVTINPSIIMTAIAALRPDIDVSDHWHNLDIDVLDVGFSRFYFECSSDESSASELLGDGVNWEALSEDEKASYEQLYHANNVWTVDLEGDFRTSKAPASFFWRMRNHIFFGEHDLGFTSSSDGSIRRETYENALIAGVGSQFTCTLKADVNDCTASAEEKRNYEGDLGYPRGCKDYDDPKYNTYNWELQGFEGIHGHNSVKTEATISLGTKTFDKSQFGVDCMGNNHLFENKWSRWAQDGLRSFDEKFTMDEYDLFYDTDNKYSYSKKQSDYCCVGEMSWETGTDFDYDTGLFGSDGDMYYPIMQSAVDPNGFDAMFCLGLRSFVQLEYEDADEE